MLQTTRKKYDSYLKQTLTSEEQAQMKINLDKKVWRTVGRHDRTGMAED